MLSKIIKKIIRLVSYLLILVTLLPIIGLGVLQFPVVQDYATSKALGWISNELGTDIQYSTVRITSYSRIRFTDLFLPDLKGDTIIYSGSATVTTPVVFSLLTNRETDKVMIKSMNFQHTHFHLAIDSSKTLNFEYILNYLRNNKKEGKQSKPIRIKKVTIADSEFIMVNESSEIKETQGINFSDMHLMELNLVAENLQVFGDTLLMDISPMSFIEKSSFTLREFKSQLHLCQSFLHLSNTSLSTHFSKINAEKIEFDFTAFTDFQPDSLPEKINMDLVLKECKLNFYDLGFFTDFFQGVYQPIDLAGSFSGTLSNLKGRQFILGWGSTSFLSGRFSMNGLPDAKETFLIFDLDEMVTNLRDIENLNLPRQKTIRIPTQFSNLKNLRYKGNFTGFFDDFVANGKLTTNLGTIFTDLMFTPDTAQTLRLSGQVSTSNFQIGALIDKEEYFNTITADLALTGTYYKNSPLSATLRGDIAHLDFNDYTYQNIDVNGTLSDKKFNGELGIDDPNLIMTFQGLIDMASAVREYDFDVDIIDANLFALNISDSDPEYHASFLLKAEAKGSSLDELNGSFNLLNSLFSKSDKQIQVYDLKLLTVNSDDRNEVIIKSDLVDATISGKYKISELKNIFQRYLYNFLPALVDSTSIDFAAKNTASINFDIAFKRTQSFFDFFYPQYLVSEMSEAHGSFNFNGSSKFNLTFISPSLMYNSNKWEGLVVNIDSEDDLLNASLGSQSFNLNQRIDLENFTLETKTLHDKIDFTTRWLNWDSTLYRGAVSGDLQFAKTNSKPRIDLNLNPSSITISDTIWNLDRFSLNIDTSGININHLNIARENQYIRADGKISDVPGDSMRFAFQDFDLANLNFLLRKKDLEIMGNLNGDGTISGRKINPLFFSSLGIDQLVINGVPLGNCGIHSVWDNNKQSLKLNVSATRGKLTMLEIAGDYFPSNNGKMDFRITLDKLKSNIFNPFLEGVFSDIKGFTSGELHLAGSKGKPTLSGKLKLLKNAFTVDYLKTRYNFTTEVEITNNNFILNNIEVYDREGNYGTVNGMIRTEYLKEFNLNLAIAMRNLLCMETKSTDNDMFFGTAFASGNIRIKGEPQTLAFNIDAETNRNTRIFIPLSGNEEVSEYSYINFNRNDTSSSQSVQVKREQQVNLSGLQMDFNLKVTPDAELQLIFDPTMGDVIRARGTGEMKLSINTLGTFDMVGEYEIEQGDYLFTLQNVINKKLRIEDGSRLRWSGDPFNANIDVVAIYRTRASLDKLFGITGSQTETGESQDSYGSTTVDCRISLTERLMKPAVKYEIYLPYSDEATRDRVNSAIQSEEEKSKQFLSLMVLNSFYYPKRYDLGNQEDNLMASNASELLSNQLSNWLSQISNDFDLGFSYRPGDEVTTREVELALSTQLFNDRLSINGSVDMMTNTNAEKQSTNKFAGDFDIDYKLNKKGKIRLRAFNRSTTSTTLENVQTDNTTYNTQGLGIFFKEEFDTFGGLMSRYWATLTGQRKKLQPTEAKGESN